MSYEDICFLTPHSLESYVHPMPKATLFFEDKEVLADGSIVEMRIWAHFVCPGRGAGQIPVSALLQQLLHFHLCRRRNQFLSQGTNCPVPFRAPSKKEFDETASQDKNK